MIKPRYQTRPIFRKNVFSKKDKKSILKLISESANKKVILDYSQLRIGLFHFLLNAVPKKSRIATTSYTIFDMINIILSSGNIPVMVDIDRNTLSPDIQSLINLVENNKVDIVVFTYLNGLNVNISELANICKKKDVLLIEDCAQSLWDPKWSDKQKKPGSYGDIALYSSGFFKIINTISGGFLLLNNPNNKYKSFINDHKKLSDKITANFINRSLYALLFKFLTNNFVFTIFLFPVIKYSKKNEIEFINKRAREENNPRYIHRTYKDIFKMNIIQRNLIKVQNTNELSKDYFLREKKAKRYIKNLDKLLKNKIVSIPGYLQHYDFNDFKEISSFYNIPLICKEINLLIEYLTNNNIDIAAQYIKNLSNTKAYKKYNYGKFKNVSDLASNILTLPTYPEYKDSNVDLLCDLINNFYNKKIYISLKSHINS